MILADKIVERTIKEKKPTPSNTPKQFLNLQEGTTYTLALLKNLKHFETGKYFETLENLKGQEFYNVTNGELRIFEKSGPLKRLRRRDYSPGYKILEMVDGIFTGKEIE